MAGLTFVPPCGRVLQTLLHTKGQEPHKKQSADVIYVTAELRERIRFALNYIKLSIG